MTVSPRIPKSVDFTIGICFPLSAMSSLSTPRPAASAVHARGIGASWHQPAIHFIGSMSSMYAAVAGYAAAAGCTTTWAFAGGNGFAVANTKRAPQRLEESLT